MRSTPPRRVVTTRDEPGRLDELLVAEGFDVVHVPLIEIGEPDDGGAAIADALAEIGAFDWVAVTSKHGARRVGAALGARPAVRLAAVGTRTAADLAELAGRAVDVVPTRQTAADLVAAMPAPAHEGERVLVAQADRADAVLADGLRELGYDVTAVTAYATRLRRPDAPERELALGADAVVFASGSAALAWSEAFGSRAPERVIVIGPTTERAARRANLKVSAVATDHTLEGLVAATIAALEVRP